MTKCIQRGLSQADFLSKEMIILTPRQIEILTLMTSGKSNYEIAAKLYISPFTVKTHLQNIFKLINVSSRSQAIVWAVKNLKIWVRSILFA